MGNLSAIFTLLLEDENVTLKEQISKREVEVKNSKAPNQKKHFNKNKSSLKRFIISLRNKIGPMIPKKNILRSNFQGPNKIWVAMTQIISFVGTFASIIKQFDDPCIYENDSFLFTLSIKGLIS